MMLNELKKNSHYFPIYSLLKSIDEPKQFIDKSLIKLNFSKADRANLDIIFWKNQNRITCLFERFEIFDEYLESKEEGDVLTTFLKEILSNKITLKEYISKKNVILKRELIYKTLLEGEIKEYSDKQNLRIIFPWTKYEVSEIIFDSWI